MCLSLNPSEAEKNIVLWLFIHILVARNNQSKTNQVQNLLAPPDHKYIFKVQRIFSQQVCNLNTCPHDCIGSRSGVKYLLCPFPPSATPPLREMNDIEKIRNIALQCYR